jgi:hypothetical protein
MRGHAMHGVDGQASLDEIAGVLGDAAPEFNRGEGIIGDENGLHFFEVGISVKGWVATEKKVGDDTYRPDVTADTRRSGSVTDEKEGLDRMRDLTQVCHGLFS